MKYFKKNVGNPLKTIDFLGHNHYSIKEGKICISSSCNWKQYA